MVAMRTDIVHSLREARYIHDITEELIDTLRNIEALFAMIVLSELGFDVNDVIGRHQGLSRRVRIPRNFDGPSS